MKRMLAVVLGLMMAAVAAQAGAQEAKPYKEGMVTEVTYVKTRPGRFNDYMKFLGTTYKALMDAQKKAGLVVGYSVFSAQPHSPRDADLILTVTYANMAALDRIDEGEAVVAKVVGSMDAQAKGAVDREALREVLGSETIRELVLK